MSVLLVMVASRMLMGLSARSPQGRRDAVPRRLLAVRAQPGRLAVKGGRRPSHVTRSEAERP